MTSYLSNVGDCGLHRRTPYGMTNISMTQLSIAKYYGGCTFQNERYTYVPDTDELIRNDVLRWKKTQERKAKKSERNEIVAKHLATTGAKP